MAYEIFEASNFQIRVSASVVAEADLKGPRLPLFISIAEEGISLYERL
jgi:hypothetical protein